MTDQPLPPPQTTRKLQPRRVLVIALFSAAIALAITLWVGNNSTQAASCPANTVGAAKLDRYGALGPLAEKRGYDLNEQQYNLDLKHFYLNLGNSFF